jgi:hypothetical protein
MLSTRDSCRAAGITDRSRRTPVKVQHGQIAFRQTQSFHASTTRIDGGRPARARQTDCCANKIAPRLLSLESRADWTLYSGTNARHGRADRSDDGASLRLALEKRRDALKQSIIRSKNKKRCFPASRVERLTATYRSVASSLILV